MNRYVIEITETLQTEVYLNATNEREAVRKAVKWDVDNGDNVNVVVKSQEIEAVPAQLPF